MSVKREVFGKLSDGSISYAFTLENKNGMQVKICDVAAAIVSIIVPDKNGKMDDIVLSYDNPESYKNKGAYLGAVVGRVANRIENARFTLNGKEYILPPNHKEIHMLHGGDIGIDSKHYDSFVNHAENSITLTCLLPDGEDGFPGNAEVAVTYKLTDDNALELHYVATADQDTPINLTNHSYFNLCGHDSGKTILDHKLQLFTKEYTPLDDNGMVDGTVAPTDGVMDFSVMKTIGRDIYEDDKQLKIASGYDHNYVLPTFGKTLYMAAAVEEDTTGRFMQVFTNSPGILLYTGNYLEDNTTPGKTGECYPLRSGFCLETGFYPNALKYPNYPQPITKVGETFDYTTIFRFGVK